VPHAMLRANAVDEVGALTRQCSSDVQAKANLYV